MTTWKNSKCFEPRDRSCEGRHRDQSNTQPTSIISYSRHRGWVGVRKSRFSVHCHGFTGRKRAAKNKFPRNFQGSLTEAGPAIRVQAESRPALAVVGAQGVHTPVLAAPIVHLALINICKKKQGRSGQKLGGVDRKVFELRNIHPLLPDSRSEEWMQREQDWSFCYVQSVKLLVKFQRQNPILFVSQHKPSSSDHRSHWLQDNGLIHILHTSLLLQGNFKFLRQISSCAIIKNMEMMQTELHSSLIPAICGCAQVCTRCAPTRPFRLERIREGGTRSHPHQQ